MILIETIQISLWGKYFWDGYIFIFPEGMILVELMGIRKFPTDFNWVMEKYFSMFNVVNGEEVKN